MYGRYPNFPSERMKTWFVNAFGQLKKISFQSGEFQNDFKVSKIKPFFLKRSRSELSPYRLVSLLP